MRRRGLTGDSQQNRVLVVEDEFFIADEMSAALAAYGFTVVGPAATVAEARDLLSRQAIDAAVLDVSLRGEVVSSLVDFLTEQGTPIFLATGLDGEALPESCRHLPRWLKPLRTYELADAIAKTTGSSIPRATP